MKFSLNLSSSLKQVLVELIAGLKRLTFGENFISFEVEVTIADQTETSGDYKIRNQLLTIPTKMIIVKQTGNALVTAGDTAWDSNFVYLKNHSTTIDSTVKVIFLK
ncbi:MAG TPA: hypothetical protein VIS27_09530 [Yeosuana sp.]